MRRLRFPLVATMLLATVASTPPPPAQAVVWQTAINPVVALELLANGTWSGTGVLGPEAFPADPFLELLTAYGSPWGIEERPPRLMTRR